MTAGNNGAGTPENDDPFAYLYRSEGGENGAQGAAGDGAAVRQPGVPRTSYNQVRAVGQRQYGTQTAQPSYGRQQPAPGGQNPHYAAPETLPGGDRGGRGPQPEGGGQGGGRGRNGLLIGAIAVVVVVCVGIGVAMLNNNDSDSGDDAGGQQPTATAGASQGGQAKPSKGAGAMANLPSVDAGSMRLEGNAATASDVPGATSANHTYVGGISQPGDGATWTFDVPKAGTYTMFVDYGVPGQDADATLTVDGQARDTSLNMGNFAGAKQGDWEHGWTNTYAYMHLNKGTNQVRISCEDGNKCGFNLSKVWLKAGQYKKK